MLALARLFIRRVIILTCAGVATFSSSMASASCTWGGASLPNSFSTPIVFQTAGFKMLANKRWYDDSRHSVGTYLGMSLTTLTGTLCTNLRELKGQQAAVVYAPPSNAIPSGSGFRIPTNAAGVAIEIEFPNGTAQNGGIYLTASAGKVSASGGLTQASAKFAPVPVKLSLVKTGSFSVTTNDSTKGEITVPGGLGWFTYRGVQDPTLIAGAQDQLLMPARYNAGGNNVTYNGFASAPSCEILGFDKIPLNSGSKVISMSPVSTSAFQGLGPVDASSKSHQFRFSCKGVADTKPAIYFSATYPLNTGVEGVGLPELGSDIGIQLLLDDVPVRFDVLSKALSWNVNALDNDLTDQFYGVLKQQGWICRKNCDEDMTGPNWENGGAASGNNDGLGATVTFKYYQTTTASPQPRDFSVPFTVTLDVL